MPSDGVSANQPPDGLPHTAENKPFSIEIRNTYTSALYFTVFGLHADGKLEIIYPIATNGDNQGQIQPNTTIQIGEHGELVAGIETDIKPGKWELTQIKIIASSSYHDFSALTVAPATGLPPPLAASTATTRFSTWFRTPSAAGPAASANVPPAT